MKTFLLLFSCAGLFMGTTAYGFDVAVYFDARSGINWRCQNPNQYFCGNSSALRGTVIDRITNEDSVYEWFHEAGVNYVIPYYPFSDDFTAIRQLSRGIKILNSSYPLETFKYLEAQYRDFLPWRTADPYVNDDSSSWGGSATVITDTNLQLNVLQIITESSCTMWRPQSELGIWNGWNRREAGISGDIYMPMHYQIMCNLRPNGSPPDTQAVATFYWIVKNTEGSGWWRYPGHVFRVGDFSNPNALDVDTFTIDPHPGVAGTFVLLDDSFQPTGPTADNHAYGETIDEYPFPHRHYTDVLDSTNTGHAFGSLWGVPVRMSVYYHGGGQTFQLYRVNVWDEGYHRLWVSQDSTHYYDTIQTAFQQQYMQNDSFMAGWYYDEFQQIEMMKSFVKVNKIMQGHAPTMFMNGHPGMDNIPWSWRTRMYAEMERQVVDLPVFMNEFYFIKDGHGCLPDSDQYGSIVPDQLPVDSSSDCDYIYAESCGSIPGPYGTQIQYEGYKSLQCAIDGSIFGWLPVYPLANMQQGPLDATYQNESGLLYQCSQVHDSSHGEKFWAMLQGNDDNNNPVPNGCCPIRVPTSNEIKLSAWLAVACDVDGILWYPVNFASGLLKWNPDSADNCFDPPRGLEVNSASIETTDRYFAAKKVGNDIQQHVAPILDHLEFVKTYASRAFERNYPDSIYAATAYDTLSDHVWCGYPIRAVQAIRSYEPCSYMDSACFMDGAEWRSYVQVSRFRNKHIQELDPNSEDYWFLVVNRRALSDEWRKVELDIPVIYDGPYYVRYVLGDSTKLLPISVNREEDCHLQTITLILKPGEAELVHFTHGEYGCADAAANVSGLTAIYTGNDAIRLRWEEPTMTEDSLPFTPQTYFILRSQDDYEGPYDTIAFTETNTYLDSLTLPSPRGFYMVHACGTIAERPAGSPIEKPVEPKRSEIASKVVDRKK